MSKILCLHGYGQTADRFRRQVSAIRKQLAKQQNCVMDFLQAPHVVTEPEDESVDLTEETFCWFRKLQHNDGTWEYCGLEQSIEFIKNYIADNGPFDGVFGFSQGAILVGILLAERVIEVKFAVLVAGYKSALTQHRSLLSSNECIDYPPTLHVFGQTDRVVACEASRELSTAFKSPQILEHIGGHLVPQDSLNRRVIIDFITSHLRSTSQKVE
ncbi:hypothetical protein MIR68_010889 [Amoeboaphelidium protococcarum]|nr:hypothetical protein MIR68_010889 [Amoeboaphelidium protococcarum]